MSTIAPNPAAPTPTPPAAAPTGITAEEFLRLYGHRNAEVVKGVVVLLDEETQGGTSARAEGEPSVPSPLHGKICGTLAFFLVQYTRQRDCGHVMVNDSFIVTGTDPLTLRGPDVCFYSFGRLPKGKVPPGLLAVLPELAAKVRSPSETWSQVFAKVVEYLDAGVRVVVVLDPPTESASVYRPDARQEMFESDAELTIPDVLPGFMVRVGELFE